MSSVTSTTTSISSTTIPYTDNGSFFATLPIKHPELNGALLGRNGSEIKKLKESSEHNFRIKLYNENDSTDKKLLNCTHIRVDSYSEDGLRDAIKLLRERIVILKEKRMNRQHSWFDNKVSIVLKMNVNNKSMFIGKSGSNIKTIENDTTSRVNVGNEVDQDGCVDINIRCENQDTLDKTIEYVKQHISAFPVFHIMKVDSINISKIIGVGGSNIKDILGKVADNTYISYKKELNGFHISAKDKCTIETVVELINDQLQEKVKTMITEDLFWDSDEEA